VACRDTVLVWRSPTLGWWHSVVAVVRSRSGSAVSHTPLSRPGNDMNDDQKSHPGLWFLPPRIMVSATQDYGFCPQGLRFVPPNLTVCTTEQYRKPFLAS
jgi:hypothetical protein